MRDYPLISIIVPVYNVEQYVGRCLDSIKAQGYSNLEIIVVNDGSTDGSPQLVYEYALTDRRFKIIDQNNMGLSGARNTGLNHCTGEYVFFVDSDDYLTSDCIESLYDLLYTYQADVVVGDHVVTHGEPLKNVYERNQVERMDGHEAIRRIFSKQTVKMVTAWGKLYRKELFDGIRFPQGLLHEDEGTTYKIYYKSRNVIVSDQPCYAYFSNPNSITTKPTKRNYEDLRSVFEEQIRFFENRKEYDLADLVRCRYCFQNAVHATPFNYYGRFTRMAKDNRMLFRALKGRNYADRKWYRKAWVSTYFFTILSLILKLKSR